MVTRRRIYSYPRWLWLKSLVDTCFGESIAECSIIISYLPIHRHNLTKVVLARCDLREQPVLKPSRLARLAAKCAFIE
jgi:hypothetical protein